MKVCTQQVKSSHTRSSSSQHLGAVGKGVKAGMSTVHSLYDAPRSAAPAVVPVLAQLTMLLVGWVNARCLFGAAHTGVDWTILAFLAGVRACFPHSAHHRALRLWSDGDERSRDGSFGSYQ